MGLIRRKASPASDNRETEKNDDNDCKWSGKIIWMKYAIYYIQNTLVHSCERHIMWHSFNHKDDENDRCAFKHSHNHN